MQNKDENWRHALHGLIGRFTGASIDTRTLQAGDLFFALKGSQADGHDYVSRALEQGAAAAIVSDEPWQHHPKCVAVPDVLQALQALAKTYRLGLDIPVVAITGSNGKTTTKELCQAVASTQLQAFSTQGNLNNHIGLPLSLLRIQPQHQLAILELGANHQGENAELMEISRPTHAIITNIGKDHLEGFGSLDGAERAYAEVSDAISETGGRMWMNKDDERVHRICKRLPALSYSMLGPADIEGKIVSMSPALTIAVSSPAWENTVEVQTQFFGTFNGYNVLAAAALATEFGISAQNFANAIHQYSPENNRSQRLEWNGNQVILDAYNANPSSMNAAIRDFILYPHPKKVLLIGDMFELGTETEREHAETIALANTGQWAALGFAGEAFYAQQPPNSSSGDFFKTTAAMKEWLLGLDLSGALLLLKGSRAMRMEDLLK